ncbi:hypothetical protein ACHAXS_007934 [Conticribra weissflogii]
MPAPVATLHASGVFSKGNSWEMQAAEKHLASVLAAKLEHPYLELAAWVQQQMCVTMVCQASLLLHGTHTKQQYGGMTQVGNGAAMLDLCPTLE